MEEAFDSRGQPYSHEYPESCGSLDEDNKRCFEQQESGHLGSEQQRFQQPDSYQPDEQLVSDKKLSKQIRTCKHGSEKLESEQLYSEQQKLEHTVENFGCEQPEKPLLEPTVMKHESVMPKSEQPMSKFSALMPEKSITMKITQTSKVENNDENTMSEIMSEMLDGKLKHALPDNHQEGPPHRTQRFKEPQFSITLIKSASVRH